MAVLIDFGIAKRKLSRRKKIRDADKGGQGACDCNACGDESCAYKIAIENIADVLLELPR